MMIILLNIKSIKIIAKQTKRIILYMLFFIIITQAGCSGINLNPDVSASGEYIQADMAYSKKNYSQAKKYYLAVLEKYPTHVNSLFRLGNINMREKKWNSAIKSYNDVLMIKPDHEKSHHNLAMLHLSLARNHLRNYISHNNSVHSKPMGDLIYAIKRYSEYSHQEATRDRNRQDNTQ